MERGLLLANDLAGVTASGVLRPSPTVSGAADLVVSLASEPVSGGLSLDNRGSQFQGIWTLGGDVAANGLWSAGDQLAASYSSSPDLLEKTTGQVHYRIPIGTDGLVASLFTAVTHGEPGGSLKVLNVITDSYAAGPRLSYPLWRGRDESLQLDGGFTVQAAKVTLLGNILQSHDQWRVLDLGATYSRVALGGAWTAGIDVAQGIGVFGATSDIAPVSGLTSMSGLSHGNPEFTKISGTLRHSRQIYGPISFAFAAQAQYAFAPLVAGEQVAYGGSQIGRGYDPAAITGDHGAGGAFELRWDERLPDYYLDLVQPYVYYDTAKVWNRHGGGAGLTVTGSGTAGIGSGASIASAGLGIRFFFPLGFTADIEVSRSLRAVIGSDNGQKATKILTDAAFRF
jgi:hemolysin activation/secretion protein